MLQKIKNLMLTRGSAQGIRYLRKPDLDYPLPANQLLYEQIGREFQLVPPLTIHSCDSDLLAGYWHATREAYVVDPQGRAMREAVAAAVSQLNACPFCITVHSGMLAAAGGGEPDGALAPEIQAAQKWAEAGNKPGSEALMYPKFETDEHAQLFGTAIVFHYTNRMVSIFLGDSPIPMPGMSSSVGMRLAKRMFARMGRQTVRHNADPGQAVVKVTADLPTEFAWARTNAHVASSLAHFAHVAEHAGDRSVPDPVREVVLQHLSSWNGEQAPLSRAWLEDLVAPLEDDQKAVARLALLSARAAWQVDEKIIQDFRRVHSDDATLVRTAAWAAFSAARRIGSWFPSTAKHLVNEVTA